MEGWKCPGCGRCYSPLTEKCHSCGPETTVTIGSVWTPCPGCGKYACEHSGTACPQPPAIMTTRYYLDARGMDDKQRMGRINFTEWRT